MDRVRVRGCSVVLCVIVCHCVCVGVCVAVGVGLLGLTTRAFAKIKRKNGDSNDLGCFGWVHERIFRARCCASYHMRSTTYLCPHIFRYADRSPSELSLILRAYFYFDRGRRLHHPAVLISIYTV